jgi:membrane associated rhomboid family serine protease
VVVLFVLCLLLGRDSAGRLLELLYLHWPTLRSGKVWTVITAHLINVPGNLVAVIFDLLFLYWFGRPLEARHGVRDTWVLVVGTMLVASGAFLGAAHGTGAWFLGSSALVYGVTVAYVWGNPSQKILFYFVLPIPLWILLALYALYDVYHIRSALAAGQDLRQVLPYAAPRLAAALWGTAFHFLPLGIDRWRDWRRRRVWHQQWQEPSPDPWVEKHRLEP